MKPATNRLTGASNRVCGVSTCCSRPSRSTHTRCPRVMASAWSGVTYTGGTPRRACSWGRDARIDTRSLAARVDSGSLTRRAAGARGWGRARDHERRVLDLKVEVVHPLDPAWVDLVHLVKEDFGHRRAPSLSRAPLHCSAAPGATGPRGGAVNTVPPVASFPLLPRSVSGLPARLRRASHAVT